MQSVSSKIWIGIAVSISYDDNHYTTGTSWIWYFAIWWWGFSIAEALGNVKYSFLALPPSSLWPGVVVPESVLSMSQIEMFDN